MRSLGESVAAICISRVRQAIGTEAKHVWGSSRERWDSVERAGTNQKSKPVGETVWLRGPESLVVPCG